jgi:DNA-binding NtrC family response regulator
VVRSGAFPAALIQGIPPRFNDGVYTCREVDLSDEALPVIIPPGQSPDSTTDQTPVHAGRDKKAVPDAPGLADDFEQAIEASRLVIKDNSVRKIFHQAWLVAKHDHVHHLILGETGTGKSRLAEWIHKSGPRSEQPIYSMNCATLTSETAASALFGHKKGAYTGADSDRPGAIRSADGGVLFLDEIGELTPELQARLLHVLDGRSILPLGSDEPVSVDVVVIAATYRDLQEMVDKGTFRQDLYGRLSTVPLTMPPLRDRPADLDRLIESGLADWNREKKTEKHLSGETLAILRRYNWPRNIRELENTLNRICMLSPESEIVPEDLPADILLSAGPEYMSRLPSYELPAGGVKLRELLADFEKDVFRQAISRAGGVMSQAAALVGWNGPAFRKAVKERYPDLDPDSRDVMSL